MTSSSKQYFTDSPRRSAVLQQREFYVLTGAIRTLLETSLPYPRAPEIVRERFVLYDVDILLKALTTSPTFCSEQDFAVFETCANYLILPKNVSEVDGMRGMCSAALQHD